MSASVASALEVEFAGGLPGLPPYTAFRLEPVAGAAGLYALRSVGGEVRLFVIDAPGDGEYAPHLGPDALAQVGAASTDEVRILLVANPAAEGVYLNLRAPIVIHEGRGTQVILDDQNYPIRVLLGA